MEKRRMVIEVVDDRVAEILRGKTGAQRLQIVNSLFRTARRLIESNVRANHVEWNEQKVKSEITRRLSSGTH
jgi:hypothetical protein